MEFTVKVKVKSNDIMQAGLIQEGIQNILNELEPEHHTFLADLADKNIARSYKTKLMAIINNPIVKKLAGSFGG